MTDGPHPEQRRSRPPRKIPVPWWGLTILGGGVGWMVAGWPGAIFGAALGFFAWKLR